MHINYYLFDEVQYSKWTSIPIGEIDEVVVNIEWIF